MYNDDQPSLTGYAARQPTAAGVAVSDVYPVTVYDSVELLLESGCCGALLPQLGLLARPRSRHP